MDTRLCSINLSIKDYESKQEGSIVYHGEVVIIDEDLKQYDFRFYNTDSGTLVVSIDASKDVIKVVEHSESVNLVLGLKVDTYQDCVYHLDSLNQLDLQTRTWSVEFKSNYILFDYDLYDKKDVEHIHPLTRNIVKIEFEEGKVIC